MRANNLPEKWRCEPLREVATINYGKSPKEILSDGGTIPVVGTGGVERYGNAYLYDNESIVLGRKGTIDKVAYVDEKFWAIDTTYYLSDFQDANVKWLYYFLQTIDFRLLNEATGVPSLSRELLYKISVLIPTPEEQTQIATILSTLDQAIEQTEAIIAKQQRIKAGLMQDLLTKGIDEHGVIRSEATHQFKDSPLGRIPVEWEVLPAHTLCEAVIDCKNRTPPESKEGHPVIRTPNVRAGKFVESGLAMTDPKSYEIWTARGKPRPGDVVITREAPFGEACRIPDNITAPCLGQRMMMYQTDPQKLRSDFMVFAIYSERVQRRLLELAGGSTVGHIRVGDIRNLSIPHPKDIDEQENIANTLTGIEKVITSLTSNVKNLRLTKAGLMHDLLTGMVRVN